MPVLYRSPLTRWVLAAVGILAGLVLTFGDPVKWRSAPSLHWLAQAQLPLEVWGVALIAYGLLLLPETTRPLGYAIGCFLFAMFTVSLFATLDLSSNTPKNVVTIAAMVDVTVFHAFSIRTAWATKLTP